VLNRWTLTVAALAALVTLPPPAQAQFTTYIAPPTKTKDSVKAAIVAEQKAVQDSVTRSQISDMKTWVDSAAGISVPRTLADSVRIADSSRITDSSVTSFANGAIAPATASALPWFVFFGVAGVVGGALLLRPPVKQTSRR
jgi:hypothetical protein